MLAMLVTDHDEKRLKSFCEEVATSLVNAKLFEDINNTRKYNENILKSLSDDIYCCRVNRCFGGGNICL